MHITETITILELVWTVLSFIALSVSAESLYWTYGDWRAVRGWKNGRRGLARRVIARQNVRNALWRLVGNAVWLAIGTVAMTQPSPNRAVTVTQIVFTVGLIIFCPGTVVADLLDRGDRETVKRLVRESAATYDVRQVQREDG